jgi:SAM-dependent methyltransferase
VQPGQLDHWSDYWAAGRLTSLPNDFAANYEGEIAAFWSAQFREVPEGGRMLDVCTGNGAIPLLAAADFAARGRQVQLVAIDAANIDPGAIAIKYPELASLVAGIEFAGNSPIETCELPDQHFDLVTSQYGIEYADWGVAARQVTRMLKPGGRLAIVCHCASPDMLQNNLALARDFERLSGIGVLGALRRFLDGTLSFSRMKRAVKAARPELATAHRCGGTEMLQFVLVGLDRVEAMDKDTIRGHRLELRGFLRYLELGHARCLDLLRINQALQANPEWYRVFEAAGLSLLDSGEIHVEGGRLMGRSHRFEKPA